MRRAILLCFGLFALLVFVQSVHAAWWNPNWQYRRAITITGSHPENYQLKIVLPFFDNSIRFTENENGPLLPYWVENWTADNMTVWVRRYQANDGTDNVIYVYYGNPNATRMDNGDATFVLFDDFLGTSLDTTKWSDYNPQNSGSLSISNGILTLTETGTGFKTRGIKSASTFTFGGYAIRARVKWIMSAGEFESELIFGKAGSGVYAEPGANDYEAQGRSIRYDWAIGKRVNGTYTNLGSYTTGWRSTLADFHTWEFAYIYTTNYPLWEFWDGTQILAANGGTNFGNSYNVYVVLGSNTTGTGYLYVDWVAVRKYVNPEPTTSVGTEEVGGQIFLTIIQPTEVDRDNDWNTQDLVIRIQAQTAVQGENADNILWCWLRIYDALNYKVFEENKSVGTILDTWTKEFVFTLPVSLWQNVETGVMTESIVVQSSTRQVSTVQYFHLVDSEGYCRYENLPGHVLSVKGEVWKFENWVLAENFNDISDWTWSVSNWSNYVAPYVSNNQAREGGNCLFFAGGGFPITFTLNKSVSLSGYYKMGLFVRVSSSNPFTMKWKVGDVEILNYSGVGTGSWQFFETRLITFGSSITLVFSFYSASVSIDALLLGARPSGVWKVGDNCFEDNNTGTHSVFWSGNNFVVENFSLGYVKKDGKVTLKFFLDNIDGIVENTYPYPDLPPYLLSYWISAITPPLVDVDLDLDNQEYKANDNFTWAIRCGDPDNDNLTITCRIYDNQGNLAFENSVQVWWDSAGYYRTFGDNKWWNDGWFVWNPVDNSPFGTCDLWVRLDDDVLTFENTAWELVYVNDITTTWSVSPTNPFHRWEVTLSGYIQLADFRPWYTSYIPGQNLWNLLGITSQTLANNNIKYLRLDDQFSGTFYPTIASPWSQTYIDMALPNQIVQVSLSVICDLNPSNPKVLVLDGKPKWSYTNDSRWKYAVRLMWEKGFDNLTDNQVENQYAYYVNFSYVTGETSGDNKLVRQYTEFLLPYQIKWATLKDNKNAYSRTLLDNGRRYLDFYLIQQQDIDAGKCLSYLYKIDDPIGNWRNGTVRFYKWVQGQPRRFITEGYWGATGEIVVYLIYDETYNILLVSENYELEYGFYVASANRTPAPLSPITRMPVVVENVVRWIPDATLRFWYEWDKVDNSLHIYVRDESGLTNRIVANLMPIYVPRVVSATNMMENVNGVFTSIFFASPDNYWDIKLELYSGDNYATFTFRISPLLHASLPAPTGVSQIVGAPAPIGAFLAIGLSMVFVLVFGQLNVGVGIVFSGITMAVLKVIGISVPNWLIGMTFLMGVLAILYERRG